MQNCIEVFESLRRGDFGQLTPDFVDDYRSKCHAIFPYAKAFMLDLPNGTVDETLGDGDDAAAAAAGNEDCIDCEA